ncbi:hypothetical protein ACJX0J_032134, partial [Zea mays]
MNVCFPKQTGPISHVSSLAKGGWKKKRELSAGFGTSIKLFAVVNEIHQSDHATDIIVFMIFVICVVFLSCDPACIIISTYNDAKITHTILHIFNILKLFNKMPLLAGVVGDGSNLRNIDMHLLFPSTRIV